MNDVPDWLWKGLAVAATWQVFWETGKWAWNHREEIAQRLRPPRTIRVTVTDRLELTDTASVQTLTGAGNLQVIRPYSGFPTVQAGRPTLRVQDKASTPSLARRLEELASWYLHVS